MPQGLALRTLYALLSRWEGLTMTLKKWLDQLTKLELEQLEHYRAGRASDGDAIGATICQWVSQGRSSGFCVPDGRPPLSKTGEAGHESEKRPGPA